MAYCRVGKENTSNIELYYQDFGQGRPAILIHGYPQSGGAWEKQVPELLKLGYRVITYDRRGFGGSDKPSFGYEYDTFAADLDQLIRSLDLRDVTLIGHSMGSGEIVRYISRFGAERIAKAVLVSPLQPFLLKTDNNPDGLEQSLFDGFQAAAKADRYAFMHAFFKSFYSNGVVTHSGVSAEALAHNIAVGSMASPKAIYDCIDTWTTDFRADLPKLTVPTLIIQGTADKVLPIAVTGRKLQGLLQNCSLAEIDGAPHGLLWTHAAEVNRELGNFLALPAAARSVA